MTSLTDRLRKRCEFDEDAAIQKFESFNCGTCPIDGAQWEHARLRPVIDCLIECLAVLESSSLESSSYQLPIWQVRFEVLRKLESVLGEE